MQNIEDLFPSTPFFDDSSIFKLQTAYSVKDVSSILNMNSEDLFHILKHTDDGTYYRTFRIPKKDGGHRLISAPRWGLGIAQTRLARILADSYKPKPHVRGYVKGQSFILNARYHERQKWILNIDIKDFYPSITFPRVRGLFMSRAFSFSDRVATILARLTTTPDGLPQGARTSPILANMIAHNLDKKLLEIARTERLKFTRYADDITFSSSQNKIPIDLVISWEPAFGNRQIKLGRKLLNAFKDSGFQINNAKTRINFRYERQVVTGLVVNNSANIIRKDISRIRMILYSSRKYGADEAAKLWIGKSATNIDLSNYIHGMLSYFAQVKGRNNPVVAKLCNLAIISGFSGPLWISREADMVRQFDVFLSHASEDKPKLRKLKYALEQINIKVFFDESSISWGDSIVERINFGLMQSTYFIPFLSENFSRKGWTNRELNSAISLNISRKGRILPIKDLDFSIGDNYPLLSDILYREWPKEDNEEEFTRSVADNMLHLLERDKHKLGKNP